MKVIKYLTVLLLILLCQDSLAQITIDGTVKDTALNPVSNALVEISIEENKSDLYTTYTDQYGNFSINNIYVDVIDEKSKIPDNNIILSNYPNPFNPSTIIYYELPGPGKIEIKIYDILGREIRALFDGSRERGIHRTVWDGKNNNGSNVAAGVYLCRLKTKDNFRVHKMVLLDGGPNTAILNNTKTQKSNQNKIVKRASLFNFTIKVSEKYINPIELRNISCNGDTTLQLIATKPLVNIIGPEGGTLSNDEFHLSIPVSGFTTNVELRLYTIPEQNSPLEEKVTNTYRLEGIPGNYSYPLQIGLKYTGELSYESVIEFGIKDFLPELNDSVINYIPATAIDSAGFLWSVYPDGIFVNDNTKLLKKGNNKKFIGPLYEKYIYLRGKSDTKLFETENFYGHLPEFVWNIPILNYLEIAFSKYKDMGFSFEPGYIPLYKNKVNAIVGFFVNTEQEAEEGVIFGAGDAYQEVDNNNKLWLFINVDFFWWLFVDDYPFKNRLQAITGIILFDAIARAYDTKDVLDHRDKKCDRIWFHKAVSYWAGELFTTESDYKPPGFDANRFAPFHGIVKGACMGNDREALGHGYGMCSLVKYLMEKAKNEGRFNTFLHDVYSNIYNDDHPVTALIKNINEPVEVWWPNFFKEYISGNIYNVPGSDFLNADENDLVKIEIKDNTPASITLTREFNDLSAKLYRFDLNYNETNANKQLQLKPEYSLITSASAYTLIFGLKNNKLEYLNGGIGTVSCNIKEVQDKGYNTLLAAIVNNFYNPIDFSSDSKINLSIKTKEKDSLNFAIVKVNVLGSYKYNNGDSYNGDYMYNPGSGDARYGTFENGQFESQWLESFYGGSSKGIIKLNVDLSSSPPKIIDYYIQEVEITSDKEVNIIEGKNVNIPGYKRSIGGYEFSVTGTETCNKITTIQNEYQGAGNYGWKLTGISCDSDSYIRIILGGE